MEWSYDMSLSSKSLVVMVDRVQIEQLLLNLERNSIEAMGGQSPVREIRVSSHHQNQHAVVVTFNDSGPGFGSMDPARIFERFVTSKPRGLGLGLSGARFIVESHGGKIWAERASGTGATIHFSLPLAK